MANWGSVKPLDRRDLDWVVAITRRRRERLVPHAPTFWRPSGDAAERHRSFLARLIDEPDVLSVRTEHGYLMALDRGRTWLVDDMVVDDPARWSSEGVALLRHAHDQCGRLRFVAPAHETERLHAAASVGLTPVERWWHRDLPCPTGRDKADAATTVEGAAVAVEGASGRLTPAPGVYDPGGPVLLVTQVDSADALRRVEIEAARRGATVSVVTQRVPDSHLTAMLDEAGHVLTTHFCE